MNQARFEGLAALSDTVYGHRHVVPVGVWIQESGSSSASQPEVRIGLEGRSPSNKVLRALERLEELGALRELPYVGRPQPRVFERIKSAHWDAIAEYATDVDSLIDSTDEDEQS
jgi:hypothetical protein